MDMIFSFISKSRVFKLSIFDNSLINYLRVDTMIMMMMMMTMIMVMITMMMM